MFLWCAGKVLGVIKGAEGGGGLGEAANKENRGKGRGKKG